MISNIPKVNFKITIFLKWFLLILLSSAVFAEDFNQDVSKKDFVAETTVASAVTKDTKSYKNSEGNKREGNKGVIVSIKSTENIKTSESKNALEAASKVKEENEVNKVNKTNNVAGTNVSTKTAFSISNKNDLINSIDDEVNKGNAKERSNITDATTIKSGKNNLKIVSSGPGKKSVDDLENETKETERSKETKEVRGIKEIKKTERTNFTKEGKRSVFLKESAPIPKTTAKTARVRDSVKEISFADNEQINVVLSNRDINRILVSNDKIQSINGSTGLYTAKNDAVGSAYISLYGNTAFTVFVSTVKGHSFSLLVTPRSVAGKTVVLTPTTPSLLTTHWEETEGYQKVLITLISSMINSEAVEDYAYSEAKKVKKTNFYGIADIRPIAFYSGSHLVGIVSEVKNKTKTPVILKSSYFYRLGVRAVALSCQIIPPRETILLYQIVSK